MRCDAMRGLYNYDYEAVSYGEGERLLITLLKYVMTII